MNQNLMILFVLVFILNVTMFYGYQLFCPHSSQRRIRAEGFCENKSIVMQYACLFDELSRSFLESCTIKADYVRPGRKYVTSVHRKSVECSQNKYQPFKFYSNELSNCIYVKSKCPEDGQVLVYNGTTETDVLCRCDYRKGFAFVHRPKNYCHCAPITEDCSCYQMECAPDDVLSKDYKCISKYENAIAIPSNAANPSCQEIPISTRSESPKIALTTGLSFDGYIRHEDIPTMKKILLPILITAVVIVMIVVILLIIRLQRKVSKTMEFIFRCRFCGKMLTDGSKCIDKKVNNAKIDASRVHKGIQLQEVTSNKDSNDKYTVFITKEAIVEVQPNSTLQPNDSWFKNYYYEEVTCVCRVNSIYEEADKNKCRKIGWKYTKISTDCTEGILKADIVYGLLLDLVLDDTGLVIFNGPFSYFRLGF